MRWTERQLAMLGEMGVRVWAPHARGEPAVPEPGHAAALALLEREVERAGAVGTAETVGTEDAVPARSSRQVFVPGDDAAGPWRAPVPGRAPATGPAAVEVGATAPAIGAAQARAARWLVVGDPAGPVEDVPDAEPFSGKALLLFENMLRALGLAREADTPARRVAVVNTAACRTPGGAAGDAAASLGPRVRESGAGLILAMGPQAAQALLASAEPIGRLRGRVHAGPGAPVVVTYHPSYLLRHPQDKARAWDDLCLAYSTLAAAAGLASGSS